MLKIIGWLIWLGSIAIFIVAQPDRGYDKSEISKTTEPVIASETVKAKFEADRAELIPMLKEMMDNKSYSAVVYAAEYYEGVDDPEFNEIYNNAVALNDNQRRKMKALDQSKKDFENNVNDISTSLAVNYCKDIVRQQLISPSTAKFEFGPDVYTNTEIKTYLVRSYVDSKNGFGTPIRLNYTCHLNYIDGKNWTVRELKLGR